MLQRLSAPRLIALGFAVFIGLGALLLKLLASTYGGISWVDALLVLLCSFVRVRSSSCFRSPRLFCYGTAGASTSSKLPLVGLGWG